MERKRELTKLRVQKYRRLQRAKRKWQQLGNKKEINIAKETDNELSKFEKNKNESEVQQFYISDADSDVQNDNERKMICDVDNESFSDCVIMDSRIDHENKDQEAEEEVNHEYLENDDTESYYSYDDGDENESTDLEDLIPNDEDDEEEQLREWAFRSNISRILVTQLLLILRRRLMPHLPKTASTFLNTKTNFNIKTIETSVYKTAQFVYFGIAKGLASCFNPLLHSDEIIYLDINIDGATLFKSSVNEFWPILCRIHHQNDNVYAPFPVAVYMGSGKPQNLNLFLDEFIEELNSLQENGLELEGRLYKIRMKSWILDTPARALIKCVKGHTGYFACERCEVQGERIDSRTTFADLNDTERTDKTFREQTQSQHHKGISLLLKVTGLNMITMFVLDFMHLGFLGIMKKLLSLWLNSPFRKYKFSQSQKQKVNFMLHDLKNQVPIEFQRKTETLDNIALWKATQFSFFLLYAGIVILKKILTPNLYQHFLLLFASCRILCSKELAVRNSTKAKLYLKQFVLNMTKFYGKSSVTINTHNLIHIADDVKNMNCHLSLINSYAFESLLGKMKKTLRSGYRPLEQLCNRMQEMFFRKRRITPFPQIMTVEKENCFNVLKIKYEQAILTTNSPNNMVLLKNNKCFEIKKMFRDTEITGNIRLQGVEWVKKKPFFTYPMNSETLGIWQLNEKANNKDEFISIFQIKKKLVKLTVKLGPNEPPTVVVIPLLH